MTHIRISIEEECRVSVGPWRPGALYGRQVGVPVLHDVLDGPAGPARHVLHPLDDLLDGPVVEAHVLPVPIH